MIYLLTEEERTWLEKKYPELKNKDPFTWCPTCKKRNNCTYRWRGRVYECDCVEQLSLHKKYLVSGIPHDYQVLDWHDWDGDPDLLAAAQEYLGDPDYVDDGRGLLLWGTRGTGKTMLAMLILKELVKQGYRCHAMTFAATVEAFTAGWRSDESKQRFEETFECSKVLLLDDLGKEYWGSNGGGLSKTLFDNLLRTRVQSRRPTFITTNMTPNEIQAGYGQGTMDLIVQQSKPWHFTGVSYRFEVQDRYDQEKAAGERRPII